MKNLVYLQYLKKDLKWQGWFLNFLESFIIRVSENAFLCIIIDYHFVKRNGEILVFESRIKKVLTSNIASFYKFNMLSFFNDVLVGDVIP